MVGIDIGGTTIDAVVVTGPDGPVLARRSRPTPADGGPALLAALIETVDDLRDTVADGPLRAVGIAVPGLVDREEGTVAHAVNLGIGTAPLALVQRLTTAIGVPVVLDNDARAAAMAALALLRRSHPAIDDVALLNLGTGLSLGLVLAGRPHRGPLGHAGEIGHVPLPGSDAACACGLRGCLEAR
ncbi:MAG TPA: ROK family protein, partial [Euzebya sp.]|nr:ROK family protein [Euzebya sp.]